MGGYAGLLVLNYRLTAQLGEGGFGVVYLAVHEQLGRRAAVKILHPEYARRTEIVERFFREAQAVCRIGHRAIVDVTHYGRLDSGSSRSTRSGSPAASGSGSGQNPRDDKSSRTRAGRCSIQPRRSP